MARRKIRYEATNDYYTFLGIVATASAAEIQRAFRSRAKELHPDLNKSREAWAKEQFQRLNEAYDVLSDSASRAEYDQQRSAASGTPWWDIPQTPRDPPPYTPPQYSSKIFTDEEETTGQWQQSTWHTGTSRTTTTASGAVLRGLFLGPYRYVFAILTIMFAANVTFIFIVQRNVTIYSRSEMQATARAVAQATQVNNDCPDPNVKINVPSERTFVDWTILTVRGTAQHPDLARYVLTVETRDGSGKTLEQRELANGDQPRIDTILLEKTDISDLPPAAYTYLRLTVILKDGGELSPCLVRITR